MQWNEVEGSHNNSNEMFRLHSVPLNMTPMWKVLLLNYFNNLRFNYYTIFFTIYDTTLKTSDKINDPITIWTIDHNCIDIPMR